MENRNPYLAASRVTRAVIVRLLLTGIGAVLTVFFGIGLFMTVTDASLHGDIWVAVLMLIPSAWLLWKGIRTGRDLELARRYAAIFAGDPNGALTAEELAAQSGRSGIQIESELERLFRKGYFQGCSLKKKPLSVLLTGTEKTGPRFVAVVCPHCGGTTRLPVGGEGRCDYCDSAIRAR